MKRSEVGVVKIVEQFNRTVKARSQPAGVTALLISFFGTLSLLLLLNLSLRENMAEWAQYLARGLPPTKKLLIGGNWYNNRSFNIYMSDFLICRHF